MGPGTTPVEITVVGIDDRTTKTQNSGALIGDPWSGTFSVQVGAFSTEESAQRLKEKLSPHCKRVYIAPFEAKGKTLYRVRVGTFKTLKETKKIQKKLESQGYLNTFMVAE